MNNQREEENVYLIHGPRGSEFLHRESVQIDGAWVKFYAYDVHAGFPIHCATFGSISRRRVRAWLWTNGKGLIRKERKRVQRVLAENRKREMRRANRKE